MKVYLWVYFFITLIISLYIHLNAVKFLHFFLGGLVTFGFFIGLYYCVKNIKQSKSMVIITRILGVIVLLGLVYGSWVVSLFHGVNSAYCYNLVGENIFTKTKKAYCDFPPWYTSIIGGEEAKKILFDDCINRPVFHNCDYYKNSPVDTDWTKGPNP